MSSQSPPLAAPSPGLELLYTSTTPDDPYKALILPIHWSVIRANNRLIIGDDVSELLPDNWATWINNSGLKLSYKNQNTQDKIEVKVTEISPQKHVAISRLEGEAVMIKLRDYVNIDKVGEMVFSSCYRLDKLGVLESKVQGLFSDEEKRVVKEEIKKYKSPYENNLTPEQLERLEHENIKKRMEEEQRNPLFPTPRYAGGDAIPRFPGDIGRSDLDPFGRLGGGMLADPRGFRGGRGMLPGGVRPPRFDPFGPRAGGGFPSFGMPDNDLERPPRGGGYDDMFM